MKIEKHFVIGGVAVERYSEKHFLGCEMYTPIENKEDTGITLYFVKNGNVLGSMRVEADCGQNIGYISDVEFTTL